MIIMKKNQTKFRIIEHCSPIKPSIYEVEQEVLIQRRKDPDEYVWRQCYELHHVKTKNGHQIVYFKSKRQAVQAIKKYAKWTKTNSSRRVAKTLTF